MKTSLYKIIFVAILNVAFNSLFAHENEINGTVTDSATKEVIVGASVLLSNGNVTVTNEFGKFKFPDLKPGNYDLKVSFIGYISQKLSVDLKADEEKEILIQLKLSAIKLSEVSVTQAKDINQTMTIINQLDKELRPINSAQDLYTLVPGLFIAQHAGGGKAEQIFLRGFDCDHGTDFAVFIDGIPVNMVSHAHGQGYADFHFVIPETVDGLKAYKGTYNVKFGNFATSGAGEFLTKNSIQKSEAKLEYGQFDTYRLMALINLLGEDKHLFSKQKENLYLATEYFFTNSYFDQAQYFKRFNIFGKYNGLLSERTSLTISASNFNSDWNATGQIPQRLVDKGVLSRFGSVDPSEGGNTDRTNINAVLSTSLTDHALIKNQVYYINYHFNLHSNFTFFLNDSLRGDEINQRERGRNIYGYNGTYEQNYKLGSKQLRSIIGLGARMDFSGIELLHDQQRVTLDTIVIGKLAEKNISAYIDETLSLTDKLSLNAALRVDYFNFSFTNHVHDSLSGIASNGKLSPKLNLFYNASPSLQLFARSGFGFHSNDARAVVVNKSQETLPNALGYEVGSTFKLSKSVLVNVVLWGLDLQQELTYTGDDGTVSINGATLRLGIDLAVRYGITDYLYADVDLNYSHGRFLDLPEGQNYIPLSPTLTSRGGITFKKEKGFSISLRYRFIDSRPAIEDNSIIAKGYFLLDAVAKYSQPKYSIGISVENLMNQEWNQAQFATESKLKNETNSVNELHFTPGTPLFVKGSISFYF